MITKQLTNNLTRSLTSNVNGAVNKIILTITPTSGEWVQSATYTEFAGTATTVGTITVTDVEWKLEAGGSYTAVDSFSGGTWSVTSITLAEGLNTLYVKATDSNSDTLEDTLTVYVDTVDPVVNLGAATTHDGSGDTFTLTASDFSEANPALVEYQLDSGGYTTWPSPYNDVVINIPADENNHTIDLRVTDLSGRTGSDQVAVNYSTGFLLDTYTGAAAAYSVRLLDSTYSGALVKIRRDSDNAEKDFYPDSNNELSMSSEDGSGASLSTWIGSDSGYVATWYDQSGNSFDVTQTTAVSQPTIVTSGSLVTENGKAAIDFDQHYLDAALSVSQPMTQIGVATLRVTAPGAATLATGLNLNTRAHIYHNITFQLFAGSVLTTSYDSNAQNVHFAILNGSSSFLTCNGDLKVVGDAGTDALGTTLRIGGQSNMSYYWDGYIQEFIIYASDRSSDESGIEGNVNDHFGVYA